MYVNKSTIRVVTFGYKHPSFMVDGLRVYGTAAPASGAYVTMARLNHEFTAKQYIEILLTKQSNPVNNGMPGISNLAGDISKTVYGNSGALYTNYGSESNSYIMYGMTFANGDRIGISYNPENSKSRFWKNGTANTEIDAPGLGNRYPCVKSGTGSALDWDFTFCVSAATMSYLPSGYLAFDKTG